MCWCRPEVRTPNCGRIECVPPKNELEKAVRFTMSLDSSDEYLIKGFYAALEKLGIEHDSDCSLNVIIQRIDKS